MTKASLSKNNRKLLGQKVKRLDITNFKSRGVDKTRPFLRYPGSKYNASKYIEPFWTDLEFEEYREPFLGSGAVFFKMPKKKISILNDVDEELINCFKVVSDKALIKRMKNDVFKINPSKEWFEELKKSIPNDSYQRALRYFLINRTAYSGIMNMPNWGFHKTKSVQPNKWSERLEKSFEKLKDNVEITSLHFKEIIEQKSNKKVWMFIDPPYFNADQKRAYTKSFEIQDHILLENTLRKTKHKFCLTYDNCSEVIELYKWANIFEVEWMYHTANSRVTTRKKGKELIITNY